MTTLRGLVAALVATVVAVTTSGRPAADVHAGAETQAASAGVLVFAAASLQTVLDDLAPGIAAATGVSVRTSYAASSVLARQIENGAPAEIFVSADRDWMDYLQARGLIRPASRVDLVSNQLVLVAPASRRVALRIGPGLPLAAALGDGRLAVADPASVPAGKYAQAALATLGVWDQVQTKLAPSENVRAALLLVSRGEAPLGIVYRTDALADRGVVVVDAFPASTHPRIVYPAALTNAATDRAARVLAYLGGAQARAVFAAHGFVTDLR